MLALVAVGVALSAASFRCIWNSDFWWQFRTGQVVAEQGIPVEDSLSFTREGAEWIELRWLFCYGLYRVMQHVGPAGVIILQWLIMLAAFGLVTISEMTRQTRTSAAIVLLVAVLAASQRFQCRPEQATYLFLALFIWLIQRARSRHWGYAAALPILQIIWVNTHTVFALGPILAGSWFVAEWLPRFGFFKANQPNTAPISRPSRLVVSSGVFGLTLLACLANPYGLDGLRFTLQLATEIHTTAFKEYIGELAGTFSLSPSLLAIVPFEVLIGMTALSAAINYRRLDVFLLLINLVTCYLAITAVRNLPLFCLAAVPFFISNIARSTIWPLAAIGKSLAVGRPFVSLIAIALSITITWSIATDRFSIWQNDSNQFGFSIARNRYPFGCADFLVEHGLTENVFNTMMEGSYLTSRGIPVFIDPRLEVYGEAFFKEYMQMLSDEGQWRISSERFGLRTAVVDLAATLVATLHADPRWKLVYYDDVAAGFTRAPGVAPMQDTALEQRLAQLRESLPNVQSVDETPWHARVSSPTPAHNVGVFLYNIGRFEEAKDFAADAVAIQPDRVHLHRLHGSVLDRLGRLDDAIEAYDAALRLDSSDSEIAGRLGRRYFSANQYDKALPLLEMSLDAEPDNAVNWALVTRIYLSKSNLDRALNAARRSVEFDPANVQYRKDVAKIYAALGEVDPMILAFLEAARLAPDDCGIWRDLFSVLLKIGRAEKARPLLERVPQACQQVREVAELMRQISAS